MNGRRDLANIGGYRTDRSPMQVVSGPLHDPKTTLKRRQQQRFRRK